MILDWLVYAVLVSGLLTLTAHCIERVSQLLVYPTRWAWLSQLVLTVVLTGVAPFRAVVLFSARSTDRMAASINGSVVSQNALRSTNRVSESIQFVRREMTIPVQAIIPMPAQHARVPLDVYLAAGWGILSLLVLSVYCRVYFGFRYARRGWPIGALHDVRVRIAPAVGPVVIGILHPDIVVPQWLLGRGTEEQRMVLLHEQEHIRAGDPWVLAIACVITVFVPWNPLVWWMASRLRLAVERDCDARVLTHGVASRTYGALLIDLAGRSSGLPTLALADNRLHLRQRLLALGSRRPRYAVLQRVVFGAVAVFFLVTAGIAQVPARLVERRANPVLTLSRSSKQLPVIPSNQVDIVYRGVKTARDSARMFFSSPGTNMSIAVGGIVFGRPIRWIDLFSSPIGLARMADSDYTHYWGREVARNAMEPNNVRDSVLVLVDSVRRGVFPVNERIPDSLLGESYTVYRGGHWAVVLYGPDAANGVINITSEKEVARQEAEELRQADSSGSWRRQIDATPQRLSSATWISFFRDSLERARLRDSILVLVDGTRRGMFRVTDRLSLSQLNLTHNDIQYFLETTGSWAVRPYGPDAAHGVVNIVTDVQAHYRSLARLR